MCKTYIPNAAMGKTLEQINLEETVNKATNLLRYNNIDSLKHMMQGHQENIQIPEQCVLHEQQSAFLKQVKERIDMPLNSEITSFTPVVRIYDEVVMDENEGELEIEADTIHFKCKNLIFSVEEDTSFVSQTIALDSSLPEDTPSIFLNSKMAVQIKDLPESIQYREEQEEKVQKLKEELNNKQKARHDHFSKEDLEFFAFLANHKEIVIEYVRTKLEEKVFTEELMEKLRLKGENNA